MKNLCILIEFLRSSKVKKVHVNEFYVEIKTKDFVLSLKMEGRSQCCERFGTNFLSEKSNLKKLKRFFYFKGLNSAPEDSISSNGSNYEEDSEDSYESSNIDSESSDDDYYEICVIINDIKLKMYNHHNGYYCHNVDFQIIYNENLGIENVYENIAI